MDISSSSFESKQNLLEGHLIDQNGADELRSKFVSFDSLDSIIQFIQTYKVIGHQFSLTEEEDQSEMGVEMQWMSVKEMIEEAYEAYPGLVAVKLGYLPIGMCLEGSGDPYFLKTQSDKVIIYRIPHESVEDQNLDEDMIEEVGSLEDLFNAL